jgi:nitrate reductase gamma subunit
MDGFLAFAQGPLFRFCFLIMVLGLARILLLDLYGAYEAYRRAGDKALPWPLITRRTLQWFVPVNRVFRNRPLYSILSMAFHVGLLLVPLFLFAHVQLWQKAVGISWPTLPKVVADWLTAGTIIFAFALFIGRLFSRPSSFLSRKQDYLWPLLLSVPFVTGFVCANVGLAPGTYRVIMLIHILAAELIFVLIPFTKIAHCVLLPLSQFISSLAWKFPAETDDAVCTTLNKKGAPV